LFTGFVTGCNDKLTCGEIAVRGMINRSRIGHEGDDHPLCESVRGLEPWFETTEELPEKWLSFVFSKKHPRAI